METHMFPIANNVLLMEDQSMAIERKSNTAKCKNHFIEQYKQTFEKTQMEDIS